METRLRLVQDTSTEATVGNTGEETITVQPGGHQGFLTPWWPVEPEPDMLYDHPRIIDFLPLKHAPISNLVFTDAATGKMVRGHEDLGRCHLTDSKADLRPKADELIAPESHTPVTIVNQMK